MTSFSTPSSDRKCFFSRDTHTWIWNTSCITNFSEQRCTLDFHLDEVHGVVGAADEGRPEKKQPLLLSRRATSVADKEAAAWSSCPSRQ